MTNGDPYEGFLMDAQSRAFREAGDEDHWDDDIPAMVEAGGVFYEPITSVDEIDLPEVVHATGWDADRLPPKTFEEAVQALHARIEDPDAPDDESMRDAYDHVDPNRVKGPGEVENG